MSLKKDVNYLFLTQIQQAKTSKKDFNVLCL